MYGGFDVYKIYLAVKNHFTANLMIMKNMVEKLMSNLKALQKEMTDTFFISCLKDLINKKLLLILLVIFLLVIISGLVI